MRASLSLTSLLFGASLSIAGVGCGGGAAGTGPGAHHAERATHTVAVSDEAGMGVVPATSAGRLFRDELGRLNQTLAAESEETELIVAGRVVLRNRVVQTVDEHALAACARDAAKRLWARMSEIH